MKRNATLEVPITDEDWQGLRSETVDDDPELKTAMELAEMWDMSVQGTRAKIKRLCRQGVLEETKRTKRIVRGAGEALMPILSYRMVIKGNMARKE